jgi:transcriptional regulator with XRE-family HTH domain
MTPAEYDAARTSLGWTHADIAEALGVSRRVPYRYASGQVEVPEPTARLLRLLVLLQLTSGARKFQTLMEEIRDDQARPRTDIRREGRGADI